jgi:hypothetical protein
MRRLKRAQVRQAVASRRFRRRLITAGTAAAVTLGANPALAKASSIEPGDKHQLAVAHDSDGDLLTDREETALGYRPFTADQNHNGIADGTELAMRCAAAIGSLPPHIEKWERPQFGLEQCDVCGEAVNMGFMGVTNHRLNLEVQFPIIALHYMEHGAFAYAGEINDGRVDVPRLARALELRFPYEPDAHQVSLDCVTESLDQIAPDANDLDGDLLADSEELAAGLNLYSADQDETLVPDGVQLAQHCAEIIDQLPIVDPNTSNEKGVYKISYMMRGIEQCAICGETVNMGYWQVVNGALGASIDIPEIARHAMQHGSFSYLGDYHVGGRTEVAALLKILELPSTCGDLGIPYDPADLNRDCKVDADDLAEFVQRWLDAIESTEQ